MKKQVIKIIRDKIDAQTVNTLVAVLIGAVIVIASYQVFVNLP